MNWKVTVVLGALLAAALGVYFFKRPGGEHENGPQGKKLFPDLIPSRLSKIEILRKGETATTLDRATDSVGEYWRLAPPIDKPADPSVLQQMLYSVDKFVNAGGMDPGRPETAPAITGLDDPRLVVTITGPAGQKETLRFGNAPPTNTSAVFFQKQGDPKIYLAAQEVLEAFDKTAIQIRQKMLTRFDPQRVVKVEIENKFERIRQGQPRTVEFERSMFERLEGADRGWWMTQPHREKLEDLKVLQLVADLSVLAIEDWRPAGDLKAQGFAEPAQKISLWPHGSEKPVTVLLGDETDLSRKRFAHVEGSGEVARIDVKKDKFLLLKRNNFRPDIVFPFGRDAVKTFHLEARGLGKVVIERRESKKDESGLVTATWELLEPKDLKIDKDKLEGLVGSVLAIKILPDGFLGPQDLKMARLDVPDVSLSLETRDGRKHVCHFSVTSTDGYMRREGMDEVFAVAPELVKIMQRLELNFRHREVFNITRDSLREFTFEAKTGGALGGIYYTARFDAAAGKWKFVKPPRLEAKEPNANLLGGVLAIMNYVQADAFIGRDPATLAAHKLDEQTAPARLTVVHQGGRAVFYISENLSDKPTRPIYYARMSDSPTVFQLSGVFVTGLKDLFPAGE
jgi:uncharacterized protein DUF4340